MSDMEIARDDLALDALAAGQLPGGDDEVLLLLHSYRADLDHEPVARVAPVVPLRPRRRLAMIALSAAAGLVVGGLTAGAVVRADQPGQLLYAAHKAVLGDPKAADRVTRLLDDAAEEIAKGDDRQAREKLADASGLLGEVDDPAVRASLRARAERLRALVAPSATASPDDDETPEPRESETPEPRESEDNSGKGSGSSGSGSGNSGPGGGDD